jgi:nucleoside-diphosphate-sugar epimerase
VHILVIGGTLFIGRALVAKLRAAGHQITILHRKSTHNLGPDIEGLTADRNDVETVTRLLRGRAFDAVFDNVYDWTRGTTAAQVLATAEAANAPHYIFLSSVAAYGEGENLDEQSELALDTHPDPYVRNKAQSERALFASGLPVTTLRPPFVYGPGNPYDRETWFWRRFAAGRAVLVPDRGERAMQFIHVDDLVDCAMRCLNNRQSIGEAFNVAGPPLTQFEFVKALAEAAGVRNPEIYGVPRDEIRKAGGDAMGPADRLYFAEYFDLPPIGQNIEKARRILGFEARPLSDGLAQTHRAWLQGLPAHGAAVASAEGPSGSMAETEAARPYAWEDGLLSCGSRVRLAGGIR